MLNNRFFFILRVTWKSDATMESVGEEGWLISMRSRG